MNPEHARFAEWDAAYVLGALSPADRRAFEIHLDGCAQCRDAIAELAPVIGLLSRVDAERARSMLSPDVTPDAASAPAPALRDAVVRRGVEAQRRRRRRRWTGLALAAAVVIVAAVGVPLTLSSIERERHTVTFQNVAGVPLTASVELDRVAWGTKIGLDCRYGKDDDAEVPADGWSYALVVTGVDGSESEVSSWRSWPDTDAWITAGTALGPDQIASIQIRSLATGVVLMRADVDHG